MGPDPTWLIYANLSYFRALLGYLWNGDDEKWMFAEQAQVDLQRYIFCVHTWVQSKSRTKFLSIRLCMVSIHQHHRGTFSKPIWWATNTGHLPPWKSRGVHLHCLDAGKSCVKCSIYLSGCCINVFTNVCMCIPFMYIYVYI